MDCLSLSDVTDRRRCVHINSSAPSFPPNGLCISFPVSAPLVGLLECVSKDFLIEDTLLIALDGGRGPELASLGERLTFSSLSGSPLTGASETLLLQDLRELLSGVGNLTGMTGGSSSIGSSSGGDRTAAPTDGLRVIDVVRAEFGRVLFTESALLTSSVCSKDTAPFFWSISRIHNIHRPDRMLTCARSSCTGRALLRYTSISELYSRGGIIRRSLQKATGTSHVVSRKRGSTVAPEDVHAAVHIPHLPHDISPICDEHLGYVIGDMYSVNIEECLLPLRFLD